jgi:uncharacterized membrane protein
MENNMERENQIIRLEITNDVNDSKRFDKKASKTILKMSKKKIVEWYRHAVRAQKPMRGNRFIGGLDAAMVAYVIVMAILSLLTLII